ncbi:hypothetical protein D3C84_1071500 [compost metagenome]
MGLDAIADQLLAQLSQRTFTVLCPNMGICKRQEQTRGQTNDRVHGQEVIFIVVVMSRRSGVVPVTSFEHHGLRH